ncbi:Rpn family recombination-promoting nuclease/putative transposase [Ruania alkalisoli]|uniref:Rpn family recombination-promoting nuclease/putative transposase n=1 Tax=Ruania alkalisoli TaxID=2779775 RepID=A0A7M1SVW6_9MICO|nr:Rpn family recombination-promoting nuclease/putative transposase [Ruania alkalisoli]QOR71611.1 Rpn family recombination-promoting nuclease/putative transposase [Ruania alkalisoli]
MENRGEHPNPHDAVFRKVVGEPVNAASVLAAALAPELAQGLDLAGLRPEPGALVDEELRELYTDLLFSTRLNGDPAHVLVLIEHQSSPDPLMPLRILEYVTRIWRRHLGARRRGRSGQPHDGDGPVRLPAVVPVVVYQGQRRWNAPDSLEGLYDPAAAEVLGSLLPRHEFVLHDLTGVEVAELLAAPLTPAARLVLAMLMFAPREQHLAAVLERFVDDVMVLAQRARVDEMFGAIMKYAYQVSDTERDELKSFFDQLGPEAQEAYMSTTLERGVAQGRAEGRAEGVARTLTRLLVKRFGPLSLEQTVRIESATLEELDAWADRVLDATSVDDVLR